MVVFKIPELLYDQYKGAGHSIASINDGEIVDFVYIHDFVDFDPEINDLEEVMAHPSLIVPVRDLMSKGEIFVGICSSYEFVVI